MIGAQVNPQIVQMLLQLIGKGSMATKMPLGQAAPPAGPASPSTPPKDAPPKSTKPSTAMKKPQVKKPAPKF